MYFIKILVFEKIINKLKLIYHFFLAFIANIIYRNPSKRLIIIGVTGTTGKTTTVYFLKELLRQAGFKVGYTSTAMFSDGNQDWLNDKKMTMLGRFFTQKMIRKMVNNGCHYGIVETTSEGIRQFRHKFINYDVLVFTGLYPEHIESHGGFENYKKEKGKLFNYLKKCSYKFPGKDFKLITENLSAPNNYKKIEKTVIINSDDEHSDFFSSFWSDKKFFISATQEKADLIFKNIVSREEGINFNIRNNSLQVNIDLSILGEFNALNASLAAGVAFSQGISLETIKEGFKNIKNIPGRLERIKSEKGFLVIVDYAFEPKALQALYNTIQVLRCKRVIHVLGGTGGGRDVSRRFPIGELVGENADVVIVTNEDPYDENPQTIIDQVAKGVQSTGKVLEKNYFKILDREEAIRLAVNLAKKDDLILITGKGCEQGICVANNKKISWDDRKIVKKYI